MKKKILWITETAVMLAALVALQYVTKPLGQLVTGSCVNLVLAVTVLAVTVLLVGASGGVTVALISPVMAYLLGIAPQILTVPAIMVGNTVFVLMLHALVSRSEGKLSVQVTGWILAAVAKFAVLYLIVAKLICGVLAEDLLASGALKEPMLKALPATFSWPQLITALIGGGLALLIVPVVRKAVKK